MLSKPISIICLWLYCNPIASAQGISTDSLPPVEKQLATFVHTSNYKPTGLDKTVMPVRVLSMKSLQALGVQNVGEALRYQSNIRLQQDNILGAGISMMGISGENVKILINGAPITGRMNGNIDLNQLPIENIERIEIVEGPMSVSYGTNALAGVINIITKKALSKSVDFQANSYYESVGTLNTSGSLGFQKGNHTLILSGGRNFFNGWSVADTSRFQEWKPKIQYYADGNYNFTQGRAQFNISSNYLNEYIINKGRPLKPYFENAFDDTYKTSRFTNTASVNHTFNKGWRVNGMLSLSQFERTKNTHYRDLIKVNQVLTDNASDHDTTRFDLIAARGTLAQTASEKLNYEVGFDINHETGMGLRLQDSKQVMGDYAAFASAEWQILKGVTVRPGLRYTHNTTYDAPLIPSLNVKWALTENWTMRASYGRGFRAPSLKELYFFFVDINHNIKGNEYLLPEESHSINTVTNYKKAIDKRVYKFEVSTFYNDIENLITLGVQPYEANAYRYINIGELTTLGGQVFGELVNENWSIAAGCGLTKRNNVFKNRPYSTDTWEARSNVTYTIPKINIGVNLWFRYLGKQLGYVLNEEEDVQPTFLDAYSMSDLGFSKKMTNGKIIVNLGVKNLFNIQNIQSQSVMSGHGNSDGFSPLAMGRFFFTKIEIRL
jgi:outer membrane receptor for ferrienterochelin and colicins